MKREKNEAHTMKNSRTVKKIVSLLTSIYLAFIVVLCVGAYLVYLVESPVECATIKTYEDALWWALNMASVGDASINPITTTGRLVGAGIILFGYSLFALIIATLSAAMHRWLTK